MLKHVKVLYKCGKLIFDTEAHVPREGSEVVVIYEDEERPTKPRSLYGIWRGKFPEDLDLDKELAKIRKGWQKRFQKLA